MLLRVKTFGFQQLQFEVDFALDVLVYMSLYLLVPLNR